MTDIRVAAEQARVALSRIRREHWSYLGDADLFIVNDALASLEAALAAQPEQQQGQGLVHPAMSTSGRTSVEGGVNAPQVEGSVGNECNRSGG